LWEVIISGTYQTHIVDATPHLMAVLFCMY